MFLISELNENIFENAKTIKVTKPIKVLKNIRFKEILPFIYSTIIYWALNRCQILCQVLGSQS